MSDLAMSVNNKPPNVKSTKSQEIFRILIMTIIAAILMWVTVFAFDHDWLLGRLITQGNPKLFVKSYSSWGTGVFLMSTLATFAWYGLACITPDRGIEENMSMRIFWAILSVLPVLATLLCGFFNSDWQVLWLCIIFFGIIGCLGYWLSTAINTPYPFQYIVPFSRELRQVFKID